MEIKVFEGRGVHILVHNVSHSDLLLGLKLSEEELERYEFLREGVTPNDKASLMARPSYSKFHPYR
jgi:hypothetical protein